jgi:hypothetical protein
LRGLWVGPARAEHGRIEPRTSRSSKVSVSTEAHAPPTGLYDALIDDQIQSVLAAWPELRSVLGKLDPEEEPSRYAFFVARVLEKALSQHGDTAARLALCNELITRIAAVVPYLAQL